MQRIWARSRSGCIAKIYGVEDGTAKLTTTPHRGPVRGSILDGGSANQARNAFVHRPVCFEPRDHENLIADRPHQAANSARIARTAFPRMKEVTWMRKHSNNSSIAIKEHVDERPIPDNAHDHSARTKKLSIRKTTQVGLGCIVLFK